MAVVHNHPSGRLNWPMKLFSKTNFDANWKENGRTSPVFFEFFLLPEDKIGGEINLERDGILLSNKEVADEIRIRRQECGMNDLIPYIDGEPMYNLYW